MKTKHNIASKIFLLFIMIISINFLRAQEYIDAAEKASVYKSISQSNSGNRKDFFTDFMQIAIKNLAGDKKTFEYKTTLFSIKSKADSSLLIDKNYVKEKFSRNFQIKTALNLDNDYKFKGFSYGFDWAIINKRDKSVETLVNEESSKLYQAYFDMFTSAKSKYYEDLQNNQDADLVKKMKQVQKIMDDNTESLIIPKDKFPKDFQKYLPKNYSKFQDNFEVVFKEDLAKIERQPLLTIGFDGQFQNNSKFFDQYGASLVYLHGLKSPKGSLEIDFRNHFVAKDSITESNVLKRKQFASQLGLNIGLMKRKNTSVLEFKPNIEYVNVFSGLMEDEKKSQFLANADLRIRIMHNIWLPLVLKYDVTNNNLLGFLNVSINFDALKLRE